MKCSILLPPRVVAEASILLLVTITIANCTDRRIEPVAEEYYLYAGMHGQSQGWIAVIECESDSLIDSVHYAGIETTILAAASPDGNYLAGVPAGFATRIWDAKTRTVIGDLAAAGERPVFLSGGDWMLTWDSFRVRFYGMPELDLDTTLEMDLYLPRQLRETDTIIAIDQRGPTSGVRDKSMLIFLDARNRRIIDSFVINPDNNGFGFHILQFDLSLDGTRLYALGTRGGGGPALLCYDIAAREVVFRSPILIPNGYCRVTPDDGEVWYTDPGVDSPEFNQGPGLIVVLDAHSGQVIDSITTTGYYADSTKALFVQDIRFVPNGKKSFVNCGSYWRGRQPLLVIDRESRQISNTIFPEFSELAEFIDIGPSN